MDSCTESINLYFNHTSNYNKKCLQPFCFTKKKNNYSPFPSRLNISEFNFDCTCTVLTKLIWFLLPPVVYDSRNNQENSKKQKQQRSHNSSNLGLRQKKS